MKPETNRLRRSQNSYRLLHARIDSVRAACRACAPTLSTFAPPHTIAFYDETGKTDRRLSSVHDVGSGARSPRLQLRAVRRLLPRSPLQSRTSPRAVQSRGRRPDLPGELLPTAQPATRSLRVMTTEWARPPSFGDSTVRHPSIRDRVTALDQIVV